MELGCVGGMRRVAWLALFALACRLMLSFGHFHAGSLAFAALETGNATRRSAVATAKDSNGLAIDFCAITQTSASPARLFCWLCQSF